MMNDPIITALAILSRFWLEEIREDDLELIVALPELATALSPGETMIRDLAVEYQRLFVFNLFPHESIFIDPSAMLIAPATERVQHLYRQANWRPPTETRAGAVDHLGLELLALSDWLAAGQIALARRLHAHHLALWLPPFILTLNRLKPHPFYHTLAKLTLALILETLPQEVALLEADPFPQLPPPPVYRGSDVLSGPAEQASEPRTDPKDAGPMSMGSIINHLLIPREAGLFLTRHDITSISHALALPRTVGERFRMLENLFRAASQFDLWPDLHERLHQLISETDSGYQQIMGEYPAWTPYGRAWRERLATTGARLANLDTDLQ